MAGKPPPRGKAASLVANERTSTPRENTKPPPVHIPTAKTPPKREKRVPLPPLLDPNRIVVPPAPKPVLRQPPSATVGPTKKHGESQRFFTPPPHRAGEPPDGYVAVRTKPPGRGGIGAPVVSKPYWLATRQKKTGLEDLATLANPHDPSAGLAAVEGIHKDALGGTAGMIFRDAAASLVPHTFVDVGNGRSVHLGTVVKDVGNLILNVTPTGGQIAGVAAAGLRGSKAARAFFLAAHEGQPVGDAVKAALRESKSIPSKAHLSKTIRPYAAELEQSSSRAAVYAAIDKQIPGKEGAKVKEALDHAAATHARAVERETGDAGAGHAAAVDYYNALHERVIPPVPGSPRTYVQAKGRLDALDRQINSFLDKVAEKVGHPSGMSERDLHVEQLNRNTRNGERLRKQSGRTRAGKWSGASGGVKSKVEKLVSQETRDHAAQVIDEMVAKHPEIPEFQMYKKLEEERDTLRAAVQQHEEQSIGGLAGHPEEAPVDFGNHPAAPAPVAEPPLVEEPVDLSYRGHHGAPDPEGNAPMSAMDEIYPPDVYSAEGAHYYGHGGDAEGIARDRATMKMIHDVRGNPDATIKVYRAVPEGVTEIHAGDWVTPNRDYAVLHADSNLGGVDVGGEWQPNPATILEQDVRAGDLYNDGNSIHEFGWHPSAQPETAETIRADPTSWDYSSGTPQLSPQGVERFNALNTQPASPDVVHAAATTAPDGVTPAGAGEAATFDPGTWSGDVRDFHDVLEWQRQLRLEFGPTTPDRVALETADGYQPRTLHAGELEVQIPQPRSEISKAGIRLVDEASKMIDEAKLLGHNVRDIPGLRLLTSTERAVKGAGRTQRQESSRRLARVGRELKAISKVEEGSPEDVATFWYAQLPASHRNADGLSLIRARQRQELEYIASGDALREIDRQEAAVKAALKDAEQGQQWPLLAQLHEFPTLRQDLAYRVEDITASIGQLSKLIVKTPPVNHAAIDAMRTLAEDRARILIDGGRLKADVAHQRNGLLARALGLDTDGTEVYVGHRLPKPESFRGSMAPNGGTGRVASPQGVGSQNELVLVKNGRVRASTRVAFEDWQSAQVFEQANVSRDDLGKMGVPFRGGNVPAGHVLVNPKGQTIPPHWKTDELAQFTDDQINRDEIRQQAKEVLQGFFAETKADQNALIEIAYQQGQAVGDLRVVPKRLVDRYYQQFRSFKGRSSVSNAYDLAIDAVSTSIVFARVGYIPKNIVQNLIMAVPHQGAMLPINGVRAGQVLSDPPLRDLILGEIGGTGATGALSREAVHKKYIDKAIHFVTSVADDPVRVAAFLHEAAAEGVISRVNPLLTEKDRDALYHLLTNKGQRARLNDIRSRAVDAMADFTRMTPDQAKTARRILIIPGWLMAGSRYPFHFAATHPIRSALIAYVALGEPGAPNELQFNQPITHYLHGTKYLQGIDTRWGRVRTSSLDPVGTPWQLGATVVGSIEGKTGPFDYTTPTVFDEAQPLVKAVYGVASGQGVKKSLLPLVPNYGLVHGLIWPQASKHYPDDSTRVGRLKREVGILPIHVNDDAGEVGPMSTRGSHTAPGLIGPPGSSSSGGYPGAIP